MGKLPACLLSAEGRSRLQQTAFAVWGSVAFVAIVFTGRGLAGAFRQELSTLAACVSAFVAAGICFGAMIGYRSAIPEGFTRNQTRLAFGLTVLPCVLLGVVLCPASSSLGIAWITTLGVGLTLGVQLIAKPFADLPNLHETGNPAETIPVFPQALEAPDLTQWMTRRTLLEAGSRWEQIEGQSTVEFAAGQSHATLHLSMCPPMSSTPEIECEVQGEVFVEWKVAAVYPYGVRLELRRPAPAADPLAVAVGYTMAAEIQTQLAKAA